MWKKRKTAVRAGGTASVTPIARATRATATVAQVRQGHLRRLVSARETVAPRSGVGGYAIAPPRARRSRSSSDTVGHLLPQPVERP